MLVVSNIFSVIFSFLLNVKNQEIGIAFDSTSKHQYHTLTCKMPSRWTCISSTSSKSDLSAKRDKHYS